MDVASVAEALADEFWDLPSGCVMSAVSQCVDDFAEVSAYFIAEAARARLAAMRADARTGDATR